MNGIGAMFRRCCIKRRIADFDLRDLRANGATKMFRADPNSIRKIQLLLGHKIVPNQSPSNLIWIWLPDQGSNLGPAD